MHRLGIVVPYRDREVQLRAFLRYMSTYLQKQGIDYRIVISEQKGTGKFNRGLLLNAGFQKAEELGCDYVVFHDVDLLPRKADYSYSNVPLELVDKIVDPTFPAPINIRFNDLSDDYFGGVTMFPVETFKKINGYSNKYIGWGFEDNDLLLRCQEAGVQLGKKKYRQYDIVESALTFNGTSSYVEIPINKSALRKSCSFLVTFKVEDLVLDPNRFSDECSVFSVPGLDLTLGYDSFGTYKFVVFDNYEDAYSVHTEKLPTGLVVQACITLDEEKHVGTFYLNGARVGQFEWPEDRKLYIGADKIYLGVGEPFRTNESNKWFKGQISEFAIFSRCLSVNEIRKIYSTGYLGLDQFSPLRWYSGRILRDQGLTLPDLVNPAREANVNGTVVSCTQEPLVTLSNAGIVIPQKRKGVFENQPHKTNGAVDGHWISWASRINQLHYRDVETFGTYKERDGLSNLSRLIEISEKKVLVNPDRVSHIQVKIK